MSTKKAVPLNGDEENCGKCGRWSHDPDMSLVMAEVNPRLGEMRFGRCSLLAERTKEVFTEFDECQCLCHGRSAFTKKES